MAIPDWLKTAEACAASEAADASDHEDKRARPLFQKNFVSKTLFDIASLIERTIFSEKVAREDGFLQRINPAVKLIVIFAFIVLTSIVQKIPILICIYLLTIAAAILSKVPLKSFILRASLFIPLFSGIIAIPVLFNFMTPGPELFTIARFSGPLSVLGLKFSSIAITKTGAAAFLFFVLRICTIVSLTTLLTLTTRWIDILKSLRIFGLPQIFVLIISLTYQFIFILLRIVEDMHFARKSRTIKKSGKTQHGKTRGEQSWVASRIGTVFIKSRMMSEETYLAMVSRGFSGEIRAEKKHKLRAADYLFASGSLAMICTVIILMR